MFFKKILAVVLKKLFLKKDDPLAFCFSAYIGQNADDISVWHGISLVQIAQSRTKLTIRTARLLFMIIKRTPHRVLFRLFPGFVAKQARNISIPIAKLQIDLILHKFNIRT